MTRRANRQKPRSLRFRDLTTEKQSRDPTEQLTPARSPNGGVLRQPCGGGFRVLRTAARY